MRRDLAGVALCALVGIFALTKAPVSVAELVSDEPLNFNFRSIPIAGVVDMIVKAAGPGEVTGIDQLGDRIVTIQIQGIPAREALLGVLHCAGFTYVETGDSLAIVPLDPPQTAAGTCGRGMKIEN